MTEILKDDRRVSMETDVRDSHALFEPFSIRNLTLENRIVMAPMTRYFSPGGTPGENVSHYYRRRAEGGCGLIITEGTTIESPVAGGYQNIPEFWGRALEGWKRVVDSVHSAGSKIMPQLWHVGLQRDPALCPNPELIGVGPSGLDANGKAITQPMTQTEIDDTVAAFASAAKSAQDIGCDGIELHGAHGYLIDQFFWHKSNLRTDKYGGSLENRARFGAEVVAAIRQQVGPDFPIVLRISQFKATDYGAKIAVNPDELGRFLQPLVDAGVDCFDCSQRRFWEPEFEGSSLNLAGWVKKLTGVASMTVGSVGLDNDFMGALRKSEGSNATDIHELLDRLEAKEFDLVAVGRALITDPEWANKVRERRYADLLAFDVKGLETLD